MTTRTVSAIILLLLSFSVTLQAQTVPHQTATFRIASAGGWDYLAVGPATKLYVSHGTQVNILDKNNGDSVGVIPNTTGIHGIAFIPSFNKGYTSNGRLNNVFVFDLNTNAVTATITTGENPDAIMYEPFSKTIITCNGRSKDLTVIDPLSNKVIATIPVGGKPETAVSNGKGKLFVNIEDKNEIVCVDMKTNTVEAHWSIAPAEEPTGLAYDSQLDLLMAGCGNKLLAVVNAGNGKLVATLPIGDGCDGVAYDEQMKTLYTSNGEGSMSVFTVSAKGVVKSAGTIPTKKSARTITLDPETHKIYLPAADVEADPANPNGRPKMIPGTFQILVFTK